MTNRLTEADMNPLKRAELRIVMSAAQPLQPHEREKFLRDVASELEKLRSDLGPGLVSRIAREAQRQYFSPPIFTGHRGQSRHDW